MEIVYPTDMTDAQWQAIVRLIPPAKDGGRPREVNMRSLVDGIFYLVRTGCAWRMLPKERERLYDLLRANASAPTYVLSGDRHVAGFYEEDIGLDAPLLEFTSSPLNNTMSTPASIDAAAVGSSDWIPALVRSRSAPEPVS